MTVDIAQRVERLRVRLEECVEPEPMSGCWLWLGSTVRKGYGQIGRTGERLVHRLAWRLFRGPIPAGLHVLHKCDTPSCINPEHLFLGTLADNMRDMVNKGRGKRPAPFVAGFDPRRRGYGVRWGEAKLSLEQMREAARAHDRGETLRSIAQRLGVGPATVFKWIRRV